MNSQLTFLQSIILGTVQGLTEFLPISSSAHLVITEKLIGLQEPGVFTEVLLHLGTLAAVMFLLRRELFQLITPGQLPRAQQFRMLRLLAIGTLPAAIGGLLAEKMIGDLFDSTSAVAIALMLTGVILFVTRYLKRPDRKEGVKSWQACMIGLAQCLALVPGISRSGMTISTGLAVGLVPSEAARFSFLLSIPIIMGAASVEVLNPSNPSYSLGLPIIAGILSSGIVGFATLRWLIALIDRGKLYHFSYYCWGMGAVTLLLSLRGK